MPMTISEAAARSRCSPPTIRYYESIGLLGKAARTASGRRSFGWPDIHRLSFIRRARDFGLGIPEIRELLRASEAPADSCRDARAVVAVHLQTIHARRAELKLLEASLQSILSRCNDACMTGEAAECTIFAELKADSAGSTA